MKKFIICLMFLLQCNVFAESYNYCNYGAMVTNPSTMEGSRSNNLVSYNNGNYQTELTSEQKYEGDKSYKIYCGSSIGSILVEKSDIIVNGNMISNSLLLELYIKGFVTKPDGLSIYALFIDENGTYIQKPKNFNLTIENADENGWHRVWGIVPPYSYNKIRFGVSFDSTLGQSFSGNLYIDNINARLLPVTTKVNNSVCRDKSFKLDDILVFGYDKSYIGSKIAAKDLINFKVVSGNAVINNNELLYQGNQSLENITVESDFLGLKNNFTVTFKKDISVGEINCVDGVYSVQVKNEDNIAATATLVVSIWSDNRLSNIYTFSKTINANSSDTITSEKISIPFYAENAVIKAYVK